MTKSSTIYAASLACLGFLCFGIASAAVGVPIWGYFENPSDGWNPDRGYFGPWKICKTLSFNREKCGKNVSHFKPSSSVFISGLLASLGTTTLGIFCLQCILQIAMISAREEVAVKYTYLLVVKTITVLISCVSAVASASLFAYQIDDPANSDFKVIRGVSFYLQIMVIVLTFGLFILAAYDVVFSRRLDGDPTMAIYSSSSVPGSSFNNPGYRDKKSKNDISFTNASGRPFGLLINGSVVSVNTSFTTISNESTQGSICQNPLRSSLKKTNQCSIRLGIQNAGFSSSGNSPPSNRTGSLKKVRIQTQSTDV